MRLSNYLIQLAPYPFLELPARRICCALIVGKVYGRFPSSQILQLLRSLTLQKSIGGKLNYLKTFLFESFFPSFIPIPRNKIIKSTIDFAEIQAWRLKATSRSCREQRRRITGKRCLQFMTLSHGIGISPIFWPTVSSMSCEAGQKTWEKIFQKSKFFNSGIVS
ncbi:MAG: hypothetical protein KR126chlam3_01154 [Chlamydiae bacterium]|nr:hypothetical protein [Chlamydiota bacterium]